MICTESRLFLLLFHQKLLFYGLDGVERRGGPICFGHLTIFASSLASHGRHLLLGLLVGCRRTIIPVVSLLLLLLHEQEEVDGLRVEAGLARGNEYGFHEPRLRKDILLNVRRLRGITLYMFIRSEQYGIG